MTYQVVPTDAASIGLNTETVLIGDFHERVSQAAPLPPSHGICQLLDTRISLRTLKTSSRRLGDWTSNTLKSRVHLTGQYGGCRELSGRTTVKQPVIRSHSRNRATVS